MFEHWREHKYGAIDHYLTNRKQYKQTNTKKLVEISESFNHEINKVVEFGCNVGRNLVPFIDKNCDITGFDISYKAIDYCNQNYKGTFIERDLYNNNTLEEYKDNHFDLGITMGFLMHLPGDKNKYKLISNIIRVCKNVILFEVTSTKTHKTGSLITENDGYFLSLENYCDYDKRFIHYDKTSNMNIFILNK